MFWLYSFYSISLCISCVVCFVCEDDIWKDCERRAEKGECEEVGEAGLMLVECRRSCREKYSGRPLPKLIQTYGGLEDHAVDVFGFKIPLCVENGGRDTESRRLMLRMVAGNNEQLAWVPKFTSVGFEKTKIPPDVYAMLLWEYERLKYSMKQEPLPKGVINCEEIIHDDKNKQSRIKNLRNTFLTLLSFDVLDQLSEKLLPLAEKWANIKLEHTSTYGIRRYTNGSTLASHVDIFHTHVISAILNIGQSVDSDWPLYIMDNNGGQHTVTMEPGEMVWYESARAIHGRPKPFQGEYFDNLFIHFSPVGDWYSSRLEIGKKPRSSPITLQDIKNKEGNI